ANQVIQELVRVSASAAPTRDLPLESDSPPETMLAHKCGAAVPPNMARVQMEEFCHQWKARLVRVDGLSFVFHIPVQTSFWHRCLGKQAGLEVRVDLVRPSGADNRLAETTIRLIPFGCGKEQSNQLLSENGPAILESVRSCVQAVRERRAH